MSWNLNITILCICCLLIVRSSIVVPILSFLRLNHISNFFYNLAIYYKGNRELCIYYRLSPATFLNRFNFQLFDIPPANMHYLKISQMRSSTFSALKRKHFLLVDQSKFLSEEGQVLLLPFCFQIVFVKSWSHQEFFFVLL